MYYNEESTCRIRRQRLCGPLSPSRYTSDMQVEIKLSLQLLKSFKKRWEPLALYEFT